MPTFRKALKGRHAAAVREALELLRKHFADGANTEGYLKDGPVAVAKFEIGEFDDDEAHALRQREANFVVESLLRQL